MILMISYDLKAPGRNYEPLYEVLKTAPVWWHYLESTWILKTSEDVSVWTEKIRAVIDTNDNFIIINITNAPRNGWLPKKAWEWINQNEK